MADVKTEIKNLITKAISEQNHLTKEIEDILIREEKPESANCLETDPNHFRFSLPRAEHVYLNIYPLVFQKIKEIQIKNKINSKEITPLLMPLKENKKMCDQIIIRAAIHLKSEHRQRVAGFAREFTLRDMGAFHCTNNNSVDNAIEKIFAAKALLPINQMVNTSTSPLLNFGRWIFWIDFKKVKKLNLRAKWSTIYEAVPETAWKVVFYVTNGDDIASDRIIVTQLKKKYGIHARIAVITFDQFNAEMAAYRLTYAKTYRRYAAMLNKMFEKVDDVVKEVIASEKEIIEKHFG